MRRDESLIVKGVLVVSSWASASLQLGSEGVALLAFFKLRALCLELHA